MFAPQDDRYLFLDMNSFFARCEQQVNPALHNKPVVVAPYTGTTGCCIAVSYEAKTLGVKTGMGVGEARALIPNLTVVESRPELYRHVHHQLVAIINDFTPYVSVRSVDEMTFPLASYEQGGDRPFALAHMIKSALKQKLGEWLTASVGIGPNVFMAKQA
ncbi:MAG: DNA polymerase, partial [Sulfurimonas sp. CG_4_10_14_0_2_um_filter_36_1607]